MRKQNNFRRPLRAFTAACAWRVRPGLAILIVLLTSASYVAASDDLALKELQSRWAARRNAIATVSIKARLFRTAKEYLHALSPKEVAGLVEQYSAAHDSTGGLKSLIEGLRNQSLDKKPYWGEITFATDRERTSEKSAHQFVKDGRADVVADLPGSRNEQAKVYSVGGSRYGTLRLDSFSIELRPTFAAKAHMVRRGNGVLVLSSTSANVIANVDVDEETGIVRRYALLVGERVARDVFQVGSVHCSEGVVFPEVVLDANYGGDNLLSRVSVLAPTEIVVNGDTPKETFQVSVPEGWQIRDLRTQGAPHFYKANSDVPDVVGYVEQGGHTGTRSWKYVLLCANILVLLCLMIFLVKKIMWHRTRNA